MYIYNYIYIYICVYGADFSPAAEALVQELLVVDATCDMVCYMTCDKWVLTTMSEIREEIYILGRAFILQAPVSDHVYCLYI